MTERPRPTERGQRRPRARPRLMPSGTPAPLSELLASTPRLALVGLAKNTGKTETLAAILAEHARAGVRVGVTSIGRDGEAHDVIDARISKPPLRLQAGDLVASTAALVRASGVAHELLERTNMRTPLGEVVIARLQEEGASKSPGLAPPRAGRGLRGRRRELVAGRGWLKGAAVGAGHSRPAVADGLVMATGAVLGE